MIGLTSLGTIAMIALTQLNNGLLCEERELTGLYRLVARVFCFSQAGD
jgi:hypothetical protein